MNFLTWLSDEFAKLFGWLGDFLEPMGKQILAGGGPILAEAALAAVQAAEAAVLGTGDTKAGVAFQAIADTLKAKGIPVIAQAVNSAIEAAVAKLYPTVTGTTTP